MNTSLSQNPSVLVITTGVPVIIDCIVTLWPDGWNDSKRGTMVKKEDSYNFFNWLSVISESFH